MYIDITAANAPNFLKNYGIARDVADAELVHSVDRKIIEWQADASGLQETEQFAQKFAFKNPWTINGVVVDQNSSVTLGDARLPEPGTALNFTGIESIDAGPLYAFGSQMSGGIWFRGNPSHNVDAGLFAAYSITPDPDRSIRFYVNTSGQLLGYFSDDGTTATQIAGSASSPSMPLGLNDGQWHHFWFTFDAGAWQFYLNGILQSSQVTSQTTIRVPTTPLLIGSDYQGNRKWVGQLSDFRLYDTVTTPSQVWALWQQGQQPWKVVAGQPEYPVIHFPLSEGSNKVAFPAQGLGADEYAASKPFSGTDWAISNPSGGGFVNGEVQLSGAYVSLRPDSSLNKVLRGGATYLVTIVIKDWNGGNIQVRPYVDNNTVNITTLKNYISPIAGPITITGMIEMPKANGDGWINIQSNGGGSTREFTVVDFKAQESVLPTTLSRNITNGSDETVYRGSDVPLNLPNLTGAGRHCRYSHDNGHYIRWALDGFDIPDQFSWRFIFTVEDFDRGGQSHVNTLVSIGYISPYWIGAYLRDAFRIIYKDINTAQVVWDGGDFVWSEGVEYDVEITFDVPAATITMTEHHQAKTNVHNMPNGFYQTTGGSKHFGGYGSGTAAGANFDGSIDFIQYKVAGETVAEWDWRQDGLITAVDQAVSTVGFPTYTSTINLPELLTTPAKPSDLTKDSYGNQTIQKAGLCPKQGQLVNSSCGTFDGNDYVTTGLSIDGYTQISCAAWVRITNGSASNACVMGRQSFSQGFELRMVSATEKPYFEVKGSLGTGSVESSGALEVGQWHHLAGTYDGTTIKLYIDGKLAAEDTQAGVNFGGNYNVIIGARSGSPPTLYWDGQIMDSRVYNRAISGAEVAAIYAGNGTATNLTGHWPFTETQGTVVSDVSGAGNDGTAINIAEDAFWGTRQDRFHHNVEKGCDVVINFPTAGGLGKIPTCPQPSGSSSCYSFWFNSANNSATSNLFRNSAIACTILPNNLRFTYAAIIDYHFNIAGTLAENEWHHCVISVDDNDATLYLNGVFSQTITGSQNPNQGGTIFIGGYATLGGMFKMAEFIVMDRPVTGAAEAASIYAGNVPSDALGAYKLANDLTDSTGNTTPVSTGNANFVEWPATKLGSSLFRSTLSHPAGVGLNSIVTQIDPTPVPDASYLRSGIGHLSCSGATNAITRPYVGNLPQYVPNMDYDTGFTISLWFRPFDFLGGGIIGGHGNNYIRNTGNGNNFIVRGSHSPNNISISTSGAGIIAGNWVHAVIRFDGSQPLTSKYNVFINGTKFNQTTALTSVSTGSSASFDRVGRYGITGPVFNGDVKQVRMFSEVFSDAQCEAMYAGTFPSSGNEEVNWPLGSHFGDVSGNERHLIPQTFNPTGTLFPVINPANFGGETYLGEALFSQGDYATLNWVWNVSNQLTEGFDISFTFSSQKSVGSSSIITGNGDQPRVYMFSDGTLRVHLAPTWYQVTPAGLNDGQRREVRIVWTQDNGGSSQLLAYIDGEAQTPVPVMSPMIPQNTNDAFIGRDSGSSNWFEGTLSDVSISLNGGTAYKFPMAVDANSTDGTYTGTFANLNTKPLFRTYDSTNLIFGADRSEPSSVTSEETIDTKYTTKGF